jgi:hypothetical protein
MVNCVSVILKIENNSFKDKMYSNRVMVMIFNGTFNHISMENNYIYIGASWSYGSWINNYLCNQCLSPLKP